MRKRFIGSISLLVLALSFLAGVIYYDSKYVKYEDIESHISEIIGYDVSIKNNVKNQEEYFLYSYRGEDNKEYIGMAYFQQIPGGRFKLLGMSTKDPHYGLYYSSYPKLGLYQHFVFFGKNSDNKISGFQLDFGDKVITESVSEDDYYLKVYKFRDKDRGLPYETFYDEYGNDITEYLVTINSIR